MARPLDTDKRRDLARRAVRVLQHEGLEIPMSRLADALEVKRPTLLYHFPTRSHIIEQALEDMLVDQAQAVLATVAEHSHPIDRLYAQIRAIHEFHDGNEARALFLGQAIAACSQDRMLAIIDIGNRVFAAHREANAERVREGIAQGLVRPCDVDALMATIRAVTDGLVVQRVMTGLDLEPVHTFFWEHVLAPLKLSKPATGETTS
ncbi:MAG: TetR/AcrR family transcriptional regulator [Myxococcales bacterium]|nr:TetR/AcrR family transcriptional regulator [Myxococcales bacterium]